MTNKTCLSVLVLTDNIHANNLKEELEFLINRNNGATCTSNAENPPEVVVMKQGIPREKHRASRLVFPPGTWQWQSHPPGSENLLPSGMTITSNRHIVP